MANIRVFDPACGSGNFLVIAYKEMRAIEAVINQRRGESDQRSVIPVTNFRGIEIRDFSAEVARLALIIAEYQCDVLYRGQKDAIQDFLPLRVENWITCANALQIDWLSVCPPTGTDVQHRGDDLFFEADQKHEVDFENEGGETYICGNPPYKGTNQRSKMQTSEMSELFNPIIRGWKALDYVASWFVKASQYIANVGTVEAAFVSTNSLNQGNQVPLLWPFINDLGIEIDFAHSSFKWSNLASKNAGVTVVIIGLSIVSNKLKKIYYDDGDELKIEIANNINAYLINSKNVYIEGSKENKLFKVKSSDGSGALDGGNLILNFSEYRYLLNKGESWVRKYILPYTGSSELIKGINRWVIWIKDVDLNHAVKIPFIQNRINKVREYRLEGGESSVSAASRPHKFAWINKPSSSHIVIPKHFSQKP